MVIEVVLGAAVVVVGGAAWWRRRHVHHRHNRAGLPIDANPYPFTQFGRQVGVDKPSHRDSGPGGYPGD